MTAGGTQMPPRVSTGDRDATTDTVVRDIRILTIYNKKSSNHKKTLKRKNVTNLTRCKAKPAGNPPAYPPHRLLIIVNWSVDWFACVRPVTSAKHKPSSPALRAERVG